MGNTEFFGMHKMLDLLRLGNKVRRLDDPEGSYRYLGEDGVVYNEKGELSPVSIAQDDDIAKNLYCLVDDEYNGFYEAIDIVENSKKYYIKYLNVWYRWLPEYNSWMMGEQPEDTHNVVEVDRGNFHPQCYIPETKLTTNRVMVEIVRPRDSNGVLI